MAQLLQELRGMFIVFTVVDMRHQRILLMSNMKNLSVVPDNASGMVAQKCAVSSSFTWKLLASDRGYRANVSATNLERWFLMTGVASMGLSKAEQPSSTTWWRGYADL
jgi:hypothetical protein